MNAARMAERLRAEETQLGKLALELLAAKREKNVAWNTLRLTLRDCSDPMTYVQYSAMCDKAEAERKVYDDAVRSEYLRQMNYDAWEFVVTSARKALKRLQDDEGVDRG